jgi:thiol-disulfide isomerase/thioredoxin
MRSHNDFRRYPLLIVVGCILTTFCISSINAASIKTSYKYQEIKRLHKMVAQNSEPAGIKMLIQKSRAFIAEHPKYKRIDQVYYIFGNALNQAGDTEEAAKAYRQLVENYPKATYFAAALLEMGLAYDRLGQHDKADAAYRQLVEHPKYGSRGSAKTAKRLLELKKEDRAGEIPARSSPRNRADALVGKKAIAFNVTDLNGNDLSLEKYRGKVILLDFWAVWCGPCIAEMPNVKQVYEKYKDANFQIIGISLDENRNTLVGYLEKEGITWPQFFDGKGWRNQVAAMYGISAIPHTYLIDGEGVIRKANVRGRALEPAVAELIQENSAKLQGNKPDGK